MKPKSEKIILALLVGLIVIVAGALGYVAYGIEPPSRLW